MKTIEHKSICKDKRILELVKKMKELEEEIKRTEEIFFGMNLNGFKKF